MANDIGIFFKKVQK